ncbi:hypothetical protein [Variovorax sp. W2I14]|uniref:hypothetical protein n=1 Tax=Variovorax sp. W2I14 TaxID=3042290 RepID=UPI003D1A7053
MDHVQQQIIDGAKAALIAAATAAGNNVFTDRVDPLQPSEIPALLIEEAPSGEQVEPQTIHGGEQRTYSFMVTAVVEHSSEYGRRARDLGLQVEKVLGVPTYAIPKPGRTRIVASRMVLSGEGDRVLAAREQTWQTTYTTRRGAPDIAL